MSDKNELQTLQRGLRALQCFNESGPANLATIARYLDVPRSNAHRIIQTLVIEGYLERIAGSRLYRVTPTVRRLASGYMEDELLATVARPLIESLAAETVWPVALATPYGSHMLVRVATDHRSPVTLVRLYAGYQTPILHTTTGLLYLALSSEKIREDVLNVIKTRGELTPYFANARDVQKALKTVAAERYAILDQRYAEASLGVPLEWHGRILGGVVTRYIKKAMPRTRAVAELLPRLRVLAADIITAFDRAMQEPGSHTAV